MQTSQPELKLKLTGCLWGYFAGDAYSMPVHWYYNPLDIIKDFGQNGITDYEAPKSKHPGSIMSLHSTGDACRGNQKGDIIGEVILKGKKHLWGQKNIHYHHGMQKGENTLNFWIVRQLFYSFRDKRQYDSQDFLQKFYNFMITKDSHPDTYAESFIRGFFKRQQEGILLNDCATPENHDTPSMGGLMFVVPLVVYGVGQNKTLEETTFLALSHLRLTHKSQKLEKYCKIYITLLYNVLKTNDQSQFDNYLQDAAQSLKININEIIQQVEKYNLPDYEVVGPLFTSACYVEGGIPSSLFLMKRYYQKGLKSTLLANTNVGGENCYRGGCIGAIIGGLLGESQLEKDTIQGLARYNELKEEIEEFVDLCLNTEN